MSAERAKPVDWDELYPGRFLKAGELKGRKATLTIKDVDTDMLVGDDGKEKLKGVLSFKERPIQVPLNKTNGICLKAMFGRKLPDWIGKRIILFPAKWNGDDCIRIWGSPDLKEELEVEVKLPRKKPMKMTMHTSAGIAAVKPGAPPPDEDPGTHPGDREPGDDGQ